jgi:hypothetical protein
MLRMISGIAVIIFTLIYALAVQSSPSAMMLMIGGLLLLWGWNSYRKTKGKVVKH